MAFLFLFLAFTTMYCNKVVEPATYSTKLMTDGFQGVGVIQDTFLDTPLVIVGSVGENFIVSFINPVTDGSPSIFTAVQNILPVIMKDQDNTYWDLFGNAVSGPGKGDCLIPTFSFMGYWFAFGTFFPGAILYEGESSNIELKNEIQSNGWLINRNHIYLGALERSFS